MRFALRFSPEAAAVITSLEADPSSELKLAKIRKTLSKLADNPRHAGLQSHVFHSLSGPAGQVVWESYVENRTSGAWRVWWWYGPERAMISILTIGPHPD